MSTRCFVSGEGLYAAGDSGAARSIADLQKAGGYDRQCLSHGSWRWMPMWARVWWQGVVVQCDNNYRNVPLIISKVGGADRF